jgi:hypothetical protein
MGVRVRTNACKTLCGLYDLAKLAYMRISFQATRTQACVPLQGIVVTSKASTRKAAFLNNIPLLDNRLCALHPAPDASRTKKHLQRRRRPPSCRGPELACPEQSGEGSTLNPEP